MILKIKNAAQKKKKTEHYISYIKNRDLGRGSMPTTQP